MNEQFYGVAEYLIDINGNLHGRYTNNQTDGIHHELNVKRESTAEFEGTYDCAYDSDGHSYEGTLIISAGSATYGFEWNIGEGSNLEVYKGIGIRAGDDRIAVSYWKVTDL